MRTLNLAHKYVFWKMIWEKFTDILEDPALSILIYYNSEGSRIL